MRPTADGFFERPAHDIAWHHVDAEFNDLAVEQLPMSWAELRDDGLIVLLTLVAFAALTTILWALRNGVPPMPSSARARVTLIALLRQLRLPRDGRIVELGSGRGGGREVWSLCARTFTVHPCATPMW